MFSLLPVYFCHALESSAAKQEAVAAVASHHLPATAYHWLGFGVLVAVLLALDLLVFHRTDHKPSLRESAGFTVFWIALGLAFNGVIWWWGVASGLGSDPGLKYLTGYLIEKALSMDNIFVFVVIFRFFHIPMMYQYRVLFWGILGAVVMRLAFILGGIELFHRFEIVAPIFGGFLLYTAYKLATHEAGSDVHPEKNIVLKTARRFFRVTRGDHHQHGHDFFAREDGKWCITPMFLVLLVIESTDVVFAIDSVPAIIGITPDRFIAFTSNVFAILGLRALYFLLAGMVDMFRYLHYGLAAILGFVGLKMIAEWAIEHEEGTHLVPVWGSLLVIAALLGISIAASIWASSRTAVEDPQPESDP
ncbi:MAG: TerC/Alx family metal homeostasis membrane protein [Pirellulales bacterium]|nr:TerC/Alx family metal homeostasis membrane protein [Pirellulales bacterium]